MSSTVIEDSSVLSCCSHLESNNSPFHNNTSMREGERSIWNSTHAYLRARDAPPHPCSPWTPQTSRTYLCSHKHICQDPHLASPGTLHTSFWGDSCIHLPGAQKKIPCYKTDWQGVSVWSLFLQLARKSISSQIEIRSKSLKTIFIYHLKLIFISSKISRHP